MITLAMDASTYRGTVAVIGDQRLLLDLSVPMRDPHSELLMPAVDRAIRESGHTLRSIDRVVCGSGPGSFTSLRIAASIAKGMAIGRDLPLLAVSSLALIVAGNVRDGPGGPRSYLAALDAMRGESYAAVFEHRSGVVRQISEMRLIASGEIAAVAEDAGARAVGPEQADHWRPHARGAALVDPEDLGPPVDLASWEPVYGRLAEAQTKWETAHGRKLTS